MEKMPINDLSALAEAIRKAQEVEIGRAHV